jgi:thiazole tautomerase (transcriptional regulator TenI)
MIDVPIVHAVTNDQVLLRQDFLARAIGVMQALGERGAVHVRSRLLPSPRLYDLTCRLINLHVETGCWCVVSDRLDIAMAAKAHGIQLNSRSMKPDDARRIAPMLRVGASVHFTDEAKDAELSGADWCVAGTVFETPSHPGEPRRETNFVSEIVSRVNIPVIAIGGVLPEHVKSLLRGGAYGVAAIRGIWEAKNSEQAAVRYLSEYDGSTEGSGSTGGAIGAGNSR